MVKLTVAPHAQNQKILENLRALRTRLAAKACEIGRATEATALCRMGAELLNLSERYFAESKALQGDTFLQKTRKRIAFATVQQILAIAAASKSQEAFALRRLKLLRRALRFARADDAQQATLSCLIEESAMHLAMRAPSDAFAAVGDLIHASRGPSRTQAMNLAATLAQRGPANQGLKLGRMSATLDVRLN